MGLEGEYDGNNVFAVLLGNSTLASKSMRMRPRLPF